MIPSDNVQPLIAFGVVAFVLVTASDFETTGPIAVAFAGVILLSTVMIVGPVAFDRVSNLVAGRNPVRATRARKEAP